MAEQAQATAAAVRGKPIPGPRGLPLLGSIRDIQRDNIQTFMDAWREYGDIVHFRGPLKINLLVHPDYVQRVLRDNYKNYPRPKFVADKLKSIVGEGLVAAEGDVWQRARKMAQPAFDPEIVNSFDPMFVANTARLLDEWEGHAARGEMIDAKSEMMHLTLANLANTTFHADLGAEIPEIEPKVAFTLQHTHKRLTSPIDPQRLPLPSSRRFDATLASLNEIIYRLIRERRAAKDDAKDLVTTLIVQRDEATGGTLTDEQLRDEIIGFFIAGHETVSSAMSWTWYLLSLNPECWRRLRDEVDQVLGGRAPTVEDIPKLTYTQNVLLESMRMYPPIFVLMRYALEDDLMGEYRVPGDSNVVLCPYVTHRHPEFWDNPEGFDPDRFLPERAAGIHRMAYFPFSGGPRKCIGNTMAMLQMPIILAMATQRFRLNLVPGQTVIPEPAISLRPQDPLLMTIERVSSAGA
jgi:cytochrome P450